MTVMQFYTMGRVINDKDPVFLQLATAKLLEHGILYNCSAHIEINSRNEQVVMGNVTEQGLIRFLMGYKLDCYNTLKNKD